MASPVSWLSPDAMHALGWALVHSLWQGIAVAALAAIAMTFCRRAPVRYLIAVGALALLLAAPVATFFLTLKPDAPVRALLPALSLASGTSVPGTFAKVAAAPAAGGAVAVENRAAPVRDSFAPIAPDILPWLVAVWFCGVAMFALRFAGGFALLEFRRRRQSRDVSARLLALCRDVERRLGLTRAIRYLECDWLEAPAMIGWLRPVVLLPVQALTGLSEEQLRAVIAHELAHVRRLDAFVNLFQIVAEALLFYHPAMWWLNRRIRGERELACDEVAVSMTGDRLDYARALAAMAEWKCPPVLAMAANRGPLPTRILQVLGQKPQRAGQRLLGLGAGFVLLAVTLGMAEALLGVGQPIPVAQAKVVVTAAMPDAHQAVPVGPVAAVHDGDTRTAAIEHVESRAASTATLPLPVRRDLGVPEMEMKTFAGRLAALTAPLVVAASAAAQPLPEVRNDMVENVVVTAPRLRPEKALDNFIIAHAKTVRPDGKIARWKSGICPLSIGLPDKFNQYVQQRIIRVAMTAGAPLATAEPCRTNLLVVATPEPQALLDQIRTKHPAALGFHYRPRAKQVATMRLPIQAWYGSVTEDFRGWIYRDYPSMPLGFEGANLLPTSRLLPDGMSVTGNRTGDGLKSLFTFALIIVDSTKIAGQEIGPLSDYIAMLALSQGQYYDVCQDIPSITNLMASGCGAEMKPVALTDIDVTYLRGLYRMDPGLSYVGQRGSIAHKMKQDLGGY